MKIIKKSWKTFASVLVIAALLGGPAFAAGLAKNSVKSKHIKDGQVLTQDVGDGQVKSADIGDDEVTNADIAVDAITETKIGTGAVSGRTLAAFTTRSASETIPAGGASSVTANCLSFERAVGVQTSWGVQLAPFQIHAENNDLVTAQFAYTTNAASAVGRNNDTSSHTFTVFAVCMSNGQI